MASAAVHPPTPAHLLPLHRQPHADQPTPQYHQLPVSASMMAGGPAKLAAPQMYAPAPPAATSAPFRSSNGAAPPPPIPLTLATLPALGHIAALRFFTSAPPPTASMAQHAQHAYAQRQLFQRMQQQHQQQQQHPVHHPQQPLGSNWPQSNPMIHFPPTMLLPPAAVANHPTHSTLLSPPNQPQRRRTTGGHGPTLRTKPPERGIASSSASPTRFTSPLGRRRYLKTIEQVEHEKRVSAGGSASARGYSPAAYRGQATLANWYEHNPIPLDAPFYPHSASGSPPQSSPLLSGASAPDSPPRGPMCATYSPPSTRSRKTLTSSAAQKSADPHDAMRSVYGNNGSGANSARMAASRRASMAASESLTAGVPVNMVSSLHSVGLVGPIFSGNFSANAAPAANGTTTNGQPSNAQSSFTSRRASCTPADDETTGAAGSLNANGSPALGSRSTFPWNLAPDHLWPAGAAPPADKLPRLRSNAAEEESKSATQPRSAPAQGDDAPSSGRSRASKSSADGHATASSSSAPTSKRRLSFKLTGPDNHERTLSMDAAAVASAIETEKRNMNSSAEASKKATPDSSVASSPQGSPKAGQRKIDRIQLRRSLTSSGTAATTPQDADGSNPPSTNRASGTASDQAALTSGLGASPLASGNNGIEESNGIIYITTPYEEIVTKKAVVVDTGKVAREKAEKAEKDRARFERAAERDRKKHEEAEEKKYRQAEAEAAKEASRLARERMKNVLAEQALAKRREADKAAAALAAERELEHAQERVPRMRVQLRGHLAAHLTPTQRSKEAEAEARRLAAQEMHPDYDPDEAGDEVVEEDDVAGNKRRSVGAEPALSPSGSTVDMDAGHKRDARPAVGRRSSTTVRQSAVPSSTSGGTGTGGVPLSFLDNLLKKAPPREQKKARPLINPRVVNAAKKGDVEEMKAILLAEFPGSKLTNTPKDLERLNKSGETRVEYLTRVDKNGSSVLFHAVWTGEYDFMEFVLSVGGSPNLQNTRRNCVLHLATERGWEDIIVLLLRHGANPLLINSNGHAPFQVLPTAKETITWASFLYITLEQIWKNANPGWVPEVELEADDADGQTDLARTDSLTDEQVSGVSTPAASSDEANIADDRDYSALSPLSPLTPQWLSELSAMFVRKDGARSNTKQLQNKVNAVMRMGLLSRLASGTNTPKADGEPATGGGDAFASSDLSSAPSSAHNTLTSSLGLASLLRKMKVTPGTKRSSLGNESGRNSLRSSLDNKMTSSTPPNVSRRSSGVTIAPAAAVTAPIIPRPALPLPPTGVVKTTSLFSASLMDL